jgi:hypothetical protein
MIKTPPPLLGEAITRQRLVPRDFTLPKFDIDRLLWDPEIGIFGVQTWGLFEMGKPTPPNAAIIWVSPSLWKAKRDFDAIVLSLPKGLKSLLRERARRGKTMGERFYYMACAYDEFCNERNALATIAFAASPEVAVLQIPEVRLKKVADAKGKSSFELDSHSLYNEVVSSEVEPEYIRECEIQKCRHIFWAGRIDQTGCSPACQRAIRDRRYLDQKKKKKMKERRSRRGRPSKRQRMLRVRNAIDHPRGITRDEISKRSELSLDEVSDTIGDLNKDYDQVKSRNGAAGERLFYLTRSAKKGR